MRGQGWSRAVAALVGWVGACTMAQAAEPTLTLGGREWSVHHLTEVRKPMPAEDGGRGIWLEQVTLEATEPLDGDRRSQATVLAVTLAPAPDSCVSLEISLAGVAAGAPLDHVETECVASSGAWRQLARVLRGQSLARSARYRIHIRGGARLHEAEVLAGPVRAHLRDLRARVAAPTLDALDQAIREARSRALHAARVDWPEATAEAVALVIDGRTRRDALPGVQAALRALGDGHSWATVLDAQGRLTANGQDVPYAAPQARIQPLAGGRDVGWLGIPLLAATGGQEALTYAATIRAGLSLGLDAGVCGFVVDLTAHQGGNMWPGLDGLGPLLGAESVVGSFRRGQAWRIEGPREGEDGRLWHAGVAQLPVAVLLGPLTASSGEAIAVAFSGRPETMFFGRRTRGLATSNQMITLGEGLVAFVMTSEMLDRQGRAFPRGIEPPIEDEAPEAAQARALAWLERQALCRVESARP